MNVISRIYVGLIALLICSNTVRSHTQEPAIIQLHPIHISVTQIDHRPKEKSLQLTIKVFSDDFEKSLLLYSGIKDLPSNQEQLIHDYFKKVLQIKVNGKAVNLNWIGFEVETDAHFVFLEITGVSKIKSLSLSNEILFNIYGDQANIVHFESGDIRKSELFQVGDGMKSIKF